MVTPRLLQWEEMTVAWGEPDLVVWVDVTALNHSWARTTEYIGPGGSGPAIGDRYARFGAWVRKGLPIWMPNLALHENEVSFTDGRHRTAWLRDHGVQALPVQIGPELLDIFQTRFGTEWRESVLSR